MSEQALNNRCVSCRLDTKRITTLHKSYKLLLENVETASILMDIDKCDDDMLRMLAQDSVHISKQIIGDARISLDVAKAAIDSLFSRGNLCDHALSNAVFSGDIERVKYIMSKMTKEYMTEYNVTISNRSVLTAIGSNRIDIIQILIDNGYKNTYMNTSDVVYSADCCTDRMAEIIYDMGIDIISYDMRHVSIMGLRRHNSKNRFLWLYEKSPDVCDPETRAAAVSLGWITE
jgi:hypothetical protein